MLHTFLSFHRHKVQPGCARLLALSMWLDVDRLESGQSWASTPVSSSLQSWRSTQWAHNLLQGNSVVRAHMRQL